MTLEWQDRLGALAAFVVVGGWFLLRSGIAAFLIGLIVGLWIG